MANYPEYLERSALIERIEKRIATVARTTMELDAVLAVLAMPLKLWKMPQQPQSVPLNGLHKTKIRQGSCAVIAMRETTEIATTTARTVVL